MAATIHRLLKESKIWFGSSATTPAETSPDLPLAYLVRGSVHEFILEFAESSLFNSLTDSHGRGWIPPLSVTTQLLAQMQRQHQFHPSSLIYWIGRSCWPTPYLLAKLLGPSWQEQNLFVDPPDFERRLWTAIQVLRTPKIFAVVLDGSKINFTATRRLQLAAQLHNGLCFILRPPILQLPSQEKIAAPSAVRTRWVISSALSNHSEPSWQLTLVKAPGIVAAISWEVRVQGTW